MELSTTDLARERDLRRMKAVALGLLVLAASVFVASEVHGGDGWIGYVRAFAEAAMVGALADWFAVTALFRHPLGLPIPHTALIPKRKDQIGRSLGEFVENNFMTPEVLNERLAGAHIGERVGEWLTDPAHAQRAASGIGDAVKGGLEVLDDREVQHGLEGVVRRQAESTPAAPLLARVIDMSMEGGHHDRLIDATLGGVRGLVNDNRDTLRQRIDQESPWWVPESIDDRIFDRIDGALRRFIDEVQNNPTHQVRQRINARLREYAERLKSDPELIAKGEQLKNELLDHPEFRSWVEHMWGRAKEAMMAAADDPNSELSARTATALQQLGQRLATEPELQAKVDAWVGQAVGHVVDNYRSEVTNLISTTVERWDGESTAKRMELAVGRDLQFIRINGTLVGGMAGLIIHALSQLLR